MSVKKNILFISCACFVSVLLSCSDLLQPEQYSNLSPFFKNFQLSESMQDYIVTNASFNDRCSSVTADPDGNIYCVGETQSGLFDENASNSQDIIAFKVSPHGKILWATQIGDTTTTPGGDTSQNDICYGVSYYNGGLYCNGRTQGSLGAANSTGTNECVAVRFDASNGSISWIRQFPDFSCNGVAANQHGVFLGGGTSTNYKETHAGGGDVLMLKLTHTGSDVWAKQIGVETAATIPPPGGSANSGEYCRDVAVYGNSLYCGGTTRGSLAETYGGDTDVFVAQFDATTSDLTWISQLGNESAPNSGNDLCWTIVANQNGPICGGRTTGSIGDTNSSGTAVDTLMVQFEASNGDIRWTHQIGATSTAPVGGAGSLTSGSGVCDEVSTDKNNNAYCGGRTPSSLFESHAGGNDIMIYKTTSNGDFVWGRQVGLETAPNDASGNDSIFGMDVSGSAIFAGGDTDGSLIETNAGGRDLFMLVIDARDGDIFFP